MGREVSRRGNGVEEKNATERAGFRVIRIVERDTRAALEAEKWF
jgi:hypothetical protein